MEIIKVEMTHLDNTKSIYEVRMAMEIVANLEGSFENYLVMSRLKDGGLGYIPLNIIKEWRILDGKGA